MLLKSFVYIFKGLRIKY